MLKGKKKYRKANNVDYVAQVRKNLQRAKEELVESIPATIRVGDVFMTRDYEYKKSRHDTPNTKTIKFDRPAVILSQCGEVVTVIPLTTKKNPNEHRYPLRVEEGKQSYALLSQVTTIEKRRLDNRMGMLKTEVFEDLRKCYNEMLEFGTHRAYATLNRHVPSSPTTMDAIRFNLYHFYRDRDTGKIFMALQLENKEKVAIYLKEDMDLVEKIGKIATIMGWLDYESMHFIGDKYYIDKAYDDLGVEYRSEIRKSIIVAMKSLYGLNVSQGKDSDYATELTKLIHTVFFSPYYVRAFDFINEVIRTPKYQAVFLNDDTGKIMELLDNHYLHIQQDQVSADKIKKFIDTMREVIVSKLDIFKCNTSALAYAAKNYSDVIHPMLMQYADISFLNDRDTVIIKDILKITKYYKKNVKWISRYIRNHIDSIKKSPDTKVKVFGKSIDAEFYKRNKNNKGGK